jgi:hypothetical protein
MPRRCASSRGDSSRGSRPRGARAGVAGETRLRFGELARACGPTCNRGGRRATSAHTLHSSESVHAPRHRPRRPSSPPPWSRLRRSSSCRCAWRRAQQREHLVERRRATPLIGEPRCDHRARPLPPAGEAGQARSHAQARRGRLRRPGGAGTVRSRPSAPARWCSARRPSRATPRTIRAVLTTYKLGAPLHVSVLRRRRAAQPHALVLAAGAGVPGRGERRVRGQAASGLGGVRQYGRHANTKERAGRQPGWRPGLHHAVGVVARARGRQRAHRADVQRDWSSPSSWRAATTCASP